MEAGEKARLLGTRAAGLSSDARSCSDCRCHRNTIKLLSAQKLDSLTWSGLISGSGSRLLVLVQMSENNQNSGQCKQELNTDSGFRNTG